MRGVHNEKACLFGHDPEYESAAVSQTIRQHLSKVKDVYKYTHVRDIVLARVTRRGLRICSGVCVWGGVQGTAQHDAVNRTSGPTMAYSHPVRPRTSETRRPLPQATPKEKAQIESMLTLVKLSGGEALCDSQQELAIVPFQGADGWAPIPDFSCLETDDDEPVQENWWDEKALDPRDATLVAAAAAAPPLDPSFHGISNRAKGHSTKRGIVEAFCLNSDAPA